MKGSVCNYPAQSNRFDGLVSTRLNEQEQQAVITLAFEVLAGQHLPGQVLTSPDQTRGYLRLKLAHHKYEVFGAVFLTSQHQVIDDRELFHGTIDGASVYPRVVAQTALELNAAALVIYHNHPSGVAEPSRADEAITRRLRDALALIDVRVLDHFVVTALDTVSFAESGLI